MNCLRKCLSYLKKCFDPSNPKDAKELLFTQLAQFTVLSTQLVVDFAKQMPYFLDLCMDDQIKMLKVCSSLLAALGAVAFNDLFTVKTMFSVTASYQMSPRCFQHYCSFSLPVSSCFMVVSQPTCYL